jgi:hypothetical protein
MPWSVRLPAFRLIEQPLGGSWLETEHQSGGQPEIILTESRIQRICEARQKIITLNRANGEVQ